MKHNLIFLILLIRITVFSQELIQNGSFEQYSGCLNENGSGQFDSTE